jgi:hypothetical protein
MSDWDDAVDRNEASEAAQDAAEASADQRERAIKEAKSWLRWAENPPGVQEGGTDDVKQFAINVLNIFDVPESEWRA